MPDAGKDMADADNIQNKGYQVQNLAVKSV